VVDLFEYVDVAVKVAFIVVTVIFPVIVVLGKNRNGSPFSPWSSSGLIVIHAHAGAVEVAVVELVRDVELAVEVDL
jgi:hypothetical protein